MNSATSLPGKLLPACGLALVLLAAASGARAGGYQVLHAFSGNADGEQPWSPPTADGAGNLYGTTTGGGINGAGTIFKITPGGTESVVLNFCRCKDGELPHAGLIMDKAGNFYGVTTYGGNAGGLGVVFKLARDSTEKVLHAFAGSPNDGQYPYGGLLRDNKGNLYGTTVAGGPDSDGTVFKVAPDGTETVLHAFANSGGDGNSPMGNLVADSQGNLYGTTSLGGASNMGTVFRLTPQGTETIIHSFAGAPNDGGEASEGLIIDRAGNLYGMTWAGGASNMGTVFKMTPDGTETILHSFAGPPADGRGAVGGVVMDKAGNLYGATWTGDANNAGGVFQLAPNGTLSVLYAFCQQQNCADGGWPVSGPVLGKDGNLYGTTDMGGEYLEGTAFELGR